jgi:hypothetical protein
MNAYVICKNCKEKIFLVIKCRIEAPLLFRATCPICGFRAVYSYTDIIEIETETCKHVSEVIREILKIPSRIILHNIIYSPLAGVKYEKE